MTIKQAIAPTLPLSKRSPTKIKDFFATFEKIVDELVRN
jgi:hypothetical protein